MNNKQKVLDIFGELVFSDEVLKAKITEDAYNEFQDVKLDKAKMSTALADKIAYAMKDWAISKGATHFTHWFQPLTGSTAEKHDAFLEIKNGKIIEDFCGKQLIKGEADASSLPNGGTRMTFEARGYTVWDCTSPAFIKTSGNMTVLYIPTAFCSYTGEALDKKTPLLRAMKALNVQGMRVLRLLGNTTSNSIITHLGPEQEYFLINKSDFFKRKDLMLCGRTLFGNPAPKGQEKEDQYYACIRERVLNFMSDLNNELWRLGITAKTQHNEVAPCQHELAPIYNTDNIATDQNQLIMETMRKMADKNDFACLLQEKPFNGINGSGKHCNWSVATDDGINLLYPGKTPMQNQIFLTFFVAVIVGVYRYPELLRISAAQVGNDLRLGANEAPPAIISIYVGDMLKELLEKISSTENYCAKEKQYLNLGLNGFPQFSKDYADRNRTSPFAFTGNKFEFRMVGSSASTATPSVIMSTITAEVLSEIADKLETAEDKSKKIAEILTELINESKNIIYNGNNYSEAWKDEAKLRNLPNITNNVDAYKCLTLPKNVALFEKHKVYSELELASRKEIYLENYEKSIAIEAKTMLKIARSEVYPAAIAYSNDLAKTIDKLMRVIGRESKSIPKLLKKLLAEIDNLSDIIENLADKIAYEKTINKVLDKAVFYRDEVIPVMQQMRQSVDALELILPKELWPMPDYTDILFYN